ncbi:unnamed protein product [Orchesella dallaii]|uniref:Uncharacterized protein n=1 Tax=Orchesella dallaii TaxID=48710 RepID=A0ABP1QFJ8_9HEXA
MMTTIRFIKVLVLLTSFIRRSTQVHDVDLFVDIEYQGNKTTVHLINCTNLPSEVTNTASSVNTHRRCTKFYDELDCKGNFIKVPTRSTFFHDLTKWKFSDNIMSVGICTDPCIPAEGHSFSMIPTNSSEFQIILYEKPYFKGKSYPIKVNGCTTLSENVRELRMMEDIKSVHVPEGKCALVYVGNSNGPDADEGRHARSNCYVHSEFDVFEFREGIPSMNNFKEWGHTLQSIKGVSPCQCNRSSYILGKPREIATPKDTSMNYKFIQLYSRANYKGYSVEIPLNFTDCLDLSEVTGYQKWEGLADSLYISEGSCVRVHKTLGCKDKSPLAIKLSVPNLAEYNLDSAIRSLNSCYQKEIFIRKNDNDSLLSYMFVLVTFLVTCIILLVVLGLLLMRRYRRKDKTMVEMISDKEIDEFLRGLGLNLENDDTNEGGHDDVKAATMIDTKGEIESLFSSDLLAQNQPYNYQLEIPQTQLKFDVKFPLGSGEYGIVYKGTLEKTNETISVAVKTTKPYSNAQCLRALLKEVKVMMYVGQHPKIVKLEGCCTNNLREGELLIVTEYCENGSLERYLRSNRLNFLNCVQKGKIVTQNFDNNIMCEQLEEQDLRYIKILPSLETSIHPDKNVRSRLDIYQLISWSIEIADAMDYLASKRVIHGDLSARNVLLNAQLTVKLSDFGLAKKMYCYSQYTRNSQEPLPWRWLALESLKNLEFSTASDVWSYGILLWEIFTLGEQPYPGVSSMTNNFVINLEQGLRPSIPPYATSDCYNVMSTCWDENPKQRPTFSRLRSSFIEIQDICKSRSSLCSTTTTTISEENEIGAIEYY